MLARPLHESPARAWLDPFDAEDSQWCLLLTSRAEEATKGRPMRWARLGG